MQHGGRYAFFERMLLLEHESVLHYLAAAAFTNYGRLFYTGPLGVLRECQLDADIVRDRPINQ